MDERFWFAIAANCLAAAATSLGDLHHLTLRRLGARTSRISFFSRPAFSSPCPIPWLAASTGRRRGRSWPSQPAR